MTKPVGFTTPAKAAKAVKTKTPSSTKRTTRQSSSSHFKAGLQRQNEIELTFSEDGPLGFLFAGSGEILQTDGQSTSSGMQVLDEITAVGDVRVIEGMGHDEVLMLLKSAARPCKITVRRMNEEVIDTYMRGKAKIGIPIPELKHGFAWIYMDLY